MNASNTNKTKKYRWDILIVAIALLLSLAILLAINLTKKEGAVAVVEINGVVAGEYSLSRDGVYPLNGGTNTLVIENGTARLIESNCPDHTCEKTGKVQYVGQTIVCLPNRLVIRFVGEQTIDAVVG